MPTLPVGTVATVLPMCLAIGAQLREIGFVVFPADVASMHLSNEKQPLLLGKRLDVERAIRMLAGLGPSEAEGSRIARVAEHFEHGVVLRWHPMEFTGMRAAADTTREEKSIGINADWLILVFGEILKDSDLSAMLLPKNVAGGGTQCQLRRYFPYQKDWN
ncbi:MAG TPA: hypothetical protein VKV20_04310 [Ktedonobacteraceae bacterium]|nr:hypothetical protein [Ktedonobacteraceae bacterium]